MAGPALYLALVHYPVYNKQRRVVTTALTSIDLHDIARSAKTYGLKKAFFILPSPSQRELAQRVMRHWLSGYGASYNPTRREALEELAVVKSLGDTVEAVERAEGERPMLIGTGARARGKMVSCGWLRERLATSPSPYLLLFGTGWGLAEEALAWADYQLEPIRAGAPSEHAYNHLSVRSAVAIILDRLLGERSCPEGSPS